MNALWICLRLARHPRVRATSRALAIAPRTRTASKIVILMTSIISTSEIPWCWGVRIRVVVGWAGWEGFALRMVSGLALFTNRPDRRDWVCRDVADGLNDSNTSDSVYQKLF